MYFNANVVFTDKIQEQANSEKIKALLKEALSLLLKEDSTIDAKELINEVVSDDSK